MNTSWQRAAATLAVIALGLTACGDEDEPTQSSSPTPTASASATSSSPTPSASASPSSSATAAANVPAAAKARTEAGAIAFLNFFFDQSNSGFLDPPNAPNLMVFADEGCIACKRVQQSISEYAEGGWSLKQPPLDLRDEALATAVTADRVIINFTSAERAQTQYLNDKATTYKTRASTQKKAAALRWVSGEWQMFDIENT
ncbi:hypothetical protein N798_13200 [Knoellia flava TL1]|uniref:DUF6318 domain-containing protein n=2 Tax=Knoellia flava TaxID=913969 RepID=A0A8H9FRN0_9MICO|nr:DUF6318 family protein [Knoellia flava]KGN29613.1 hypothetical protein N798_13200 [Knoellia flava TL1]GGB76039.1 hypothetical protein GCM10011314_14510 [Knoellia flava]